MPKKDDKNCYKKCVYCKKAKKVGETKGGKKGVKKMEKPRN